MILFNPFQRTQGLASTALSRKSDSSFKQKFHPTAWPKQGDSHLFGFHISKALVSSSEKSSSNYSMQKHMMTDTNQGRYSHFCGSQKGRNKGVLWFSLRNQAAAVLTQKVCPKTPPRQNTPSPTDFTEVKQVVLLDLGNQTLYLLSLKACPATHTDN